MSKDESMQFLAEYREKILRDRESEIQEGIERGFEQGRKEGFHQGFEQGLQRRRQELILNMLEKGMKIKRISEVTCLSVRQIKDVLASTSNMI